MKSFDSVVLIVYKWALKYNNLISCIKSSELPERLGWQFKNKKHGIMVPTIMVKDFLHKYWNAK